VVEIVHTYVHVGGTGLPGRVLQVAGWGKETAVRMLELQHMLQIMLFHCT